MRAPNLWDDTLIWGASAPTLYLSTAALLLTTLVWYLYKPYWPVRAIPGPPLIPIVGHLPLLSRYGPDVFSVLAKRYGPIFRFHMGRQPLVMVADAELCKQVCIKLFKQITNRSTPPPVAASVLHSNGLFLSRGERWWAMRNAMVSVYQPSHVATLVPIMQNLVESAEHSLRAAAESSEEISFDNFTLMLATDIICRTAFGADFGLSSAGEKERREGGMAELVKRHMFTTAKLKMDLRGSASMLAGLVLPFLQRPLHETLTRLGWTTDSLIEGTSMELSRLLDKLVFRTREEEEMRKKDFLSAVFKARDADDASRQVFSHEFVSGTAYEQMLAGSATTAFTLATTVYLVTGHRRVEEKLLHEIDLFWKTGRLPSASDLQSRFPYLDQVVKEAMRFYTVSPLVARETSSEVELGGYLLPKGTWVWLAIGVLAKDGVNFKDPEIFRPERFDPECEEAKQRHPYAHIPFGVGPRACIGDKFAIQEIKLCLINIYRNYVFQYLGDMKKPLGLQYGMVLHLTDAMKLKVIRRT